MSESGTKILIFLGSLIATLLLVLIVVILTEEDSAHPASTTSAAASPTTTAAAPTTSTVAPTTSTTATTAAATTGAAPVTTAAPPTTSVPVYLLPQGYGPITQGTDYSALVASGDIVFEGWDTTPPDSYCGWGNGAGSQAGLVRTQIIDLVVQVVFATDPSVTTPEGISLGSAEAEVVAAYGAPHEEHPGPYVPTERWIYYQFGAHGYKFIFESAGGPVWQMYAGDWEKIHLSEGCL